MESLNYLKMIFIYIDLTKYSKKLSIQNINDIPKKVIK